MKAFAEAGCPVKIVPPWPCSFLARGQEHCRVSQTSAPRCSQQTTMYLTPVRRVALANKNENVRNCTKVEGLPKCPLVRKEPKGTARDVRPCKTEPSLGTGKFCAVARTSLNASDRLVILIVEDEVLLRCAIVDYLRDGGCIVLEAESAEQAAAICR